MWKLSLAENASTEIFNVVGGKVFDPNFDPYDKIRALEQSLRQQKEFNKQVTDAVNAQHELIQQLHGRIRLLEMVKQYEEKN